MDIPSDDEQIQAIKEDLETNGPASAAAKIQARLDEQDKIPLNIAITGESGSGKSTFVNAFRGIDNRDEGAAPTGCVETTMEVKSYPHPIYPNVTLWDLPGIGTTKFPAEEYLKKVEFENFDFLIIISDTRFRENDVKLALQIQKMKKKFYFVRSKIDDNLRAEERSQRDFKAEITLKQIRDYCIQGLQDQGFESPQVFLVSSFDLHLYDFHLLEETLEEELPAHKRHALLMAMPNISLEIINKKKEALQTNIKLKAYVSAVTACVPIPGLSVCTDMTMLVKTTTQYKVDFGLDSESLQRLSLSAGVPLKDLTAVMTSSLGTHIVTTGRLIKLLCVYVSQTVLLIAEEGLRFIPLIGIPAAMTLSYKFTYNALNTFLDMIAEDAQRVFEKALRLDTSV